MIVLLIILLILLTVLLIPAGAFVHYDQAGVKLSVVAGPVKIQILPRKEKGDGKESEKKKKTKEQKDKKKKNKKKNDNQSTETAKQPEEKQPLGGKIEFFKKLLNIALSALNCLWHKLRMDRLVLSLTVAGKNTDAAGAAMKYGEAWAAIGVLIPVIEKHFILCKRDLNVYLDYAAEQNTIYAEAQITIRIGSVLWIALHYGIRILIVFLSNKKKKHVKGGKQNGTSD